MLSVALLVPELLGEIMLRLPSSIDQKFAFAQVSRFWRGVALDSPLFWSSFSGRDSEIDFYRLPMVLSRSGSNTVLRVEFRFTYRWPEDALKILVPYAARIEVLDLSIGCDVTIFECTALLGSDVEFPALRTLRLQGTEGNRFPPLALKAPQLRTLDLECIFRAVEWETLLVPSLESIRRPSKHSLSSSINVPERGVSRCTFSICIAATTLPITLRPLAPALRELELQLEDHDLTRVLKIGFSDILLPTLTCSIYEGYGDENLDTLTGALLPGVGPLVFFQLLDEQDRIELHDNAGHIRRLECWDADSLFDGSDTWEYLSRRYELHKTVREIRVIDTDDYGWMRYVEAFELYPPQQDGITLGIQFAG
ncbi:hypothetical protein C8F04DRAFT_888543, partial [Mycena alexandri]